MQRQFSTRRPQLDSETANGTGCSGDNGELSVRNTTAGGQNGVDMMRIHENKLCGLDETEMERQTARISFNTEAEFSALQHKVRFYNFIKDCTL